MPLSPASTHPLPVAANDWPGLAAATLSTWHAELHRRAGLQRVQQARLCLGAAWAQAGRHNSRLQALALRLARDGAAVQVLVLPGLTQPELRLGWSPWHAPPTQAASQLSPRQKTPNRTGEPAMKVPFLTQLFGQPAGPATTQPGLHDEPSLQPLGVQNPPRQGPALARALAQIADQIAALEVRDLLELDTEGCRFQLWTLTFWISAANQPALRSLVDLNQRDAGVAKALVERGFSKGEGARLLNTLRLRLEFKRGDSLPRDVSEVLIACGRDSVTLPFSYTGQIELGAAAAAGLPVAAAGRPAAPGELQAQAQAAGASLLLWAQLPGQAALQRWRFPAGPVAVGAADGATVAVNHHHVSGEHLLLSQDPSGHWQVEDRSRNGSSLFDAALEPAAERPLPTRLPQPLPAAGALRLGPLPDDPLLNFQIIWPATQRPPAADSAGAAPQRRVTQLAAGVGTAVAQPARRVTGLS